MILAPYLQIQLLSYTINPLLVQLGLAGGSALVGALTKNRKDDLFEQALTKRQERTARIQRFSRGDFNPNERALISGGNEANLNALRGQVSAQGLSGGAAEELVAQQRQRPFENLQSAALGLEGSALSQEEQLVSQLSDDDLTGFFDDIAGISQGLTLLEGLKRLPSAGGTTVDTSLVDEATGLIEQLMQTA